MEPVDDILVQRHCKPDAFMNRIDQRYRHSSGLAIHSIDRKIPAPKAVLDRPIPHKSKYHDKIIQEIRESKKYEQIQAEKLNARKAINEQYKSAVSDYQEMIKLKEYKNSKLGKLKEHFGFYTESDSIEPNPVIMAMFAHFNNVGSLPVLMSE